MEIERLISKYVSENCYIVKDGKSTVVIDPTDNAERLIEGLGGNKLSAILLTHGHFDHIGCTDALIAKTGAELYIGKADAEMLPSPEKNGSTDISGEPVRAFTVPKTIEGDGKLKLGCIEVSYFATPGHSKGGCCYLIGNYLFCGDLLFEGGGYGRTDLYGGSLREVYASVMRMLKLDGDTIVCPGHGERFLLKNYR